MRTDDLILRTFVPDALDTPSPTLDFIQTQVAALDYRDPLVLMVADQQELYCQVVRSRGDERFWQVEVRLGEEVEHYVVRVGSADVAGELIRAWVQDREVLPVGPRWARWHADRDPLAQRPYDLTAYVAGAGVKPLWSREQWNLLIPVLQPLVTTDRGRTVVSSLQLESEPAKPTDPFVRFGQLSFNAASHERWTHGPSTMGRRFSSVEIWAPGWKVCYRQGIAPETYLQVHAVRDGERFTVMLATAADGSQAAVAPVHQALTELLQPSVVASKRRPWGWSFNDHSYNSPIDSITPVSLPVDRPLKLREDGPYLRAKPQPWRVLFADGDSQRDLASRGGSS